MPGENRPPNFDDMGLEAESAFKDTTPDKGSKGGAVGDINNTENADRNKFSEFFENNNVRRVVSSVLILATAAGIGYGTKQYSKWLESSRAEAATAAEAAAIEAFNNSVDDFRDNLIKQGHSEEDINTALTIYKDPDFQQLISEFRNDNPAIDDRDIIEYMADRGIEFDGEKGEEVIEGLIPPGTPQTVIDQNFEGLDTTKIE